MKRADKRFRGCAQVFVVTAGIVLGAKTQADQVWNYTYNAQGWVETTDGPRDDVADVTTYGYDAAGHITQLTNALGHVTQMLDYNGYGQPQRIIDPNGVETRLDYHARGWLLSSTVKDPGGDSTRDAVTVYDFDAVGQVIQITTPGGGILRYEYDDARRLVAVQNSAGERIEYTLDAAGNRTGEAIKSATGEIKNTVTRVYDELSRIKQTIGAASQTANYHYDYNGNLVQAVDARINSTDSAFDALDRLTAVTDADGYTANYAYDDQDRLVQVTDPRGLSTTYTYDAYGNQIEQVSPDTGTTFHDYDSAGNRIRSTDARGVVVEFSYDALNRLIAVTYPANPALNVSYTYDDTTGGNYGIGRLTHITDATGSTHYRYNHRGQLIEKRVVLDGLTFYWSYAYNADGAVSDVLFPSGRHLRFTRDNQGRLQAVYTRSWAGAAEKLLATNFSYLPFGGVTGFFYGNSVHRTVEYDQDYRINHLLDQGDATVLDRTYSLDPVSNITGIDDSIDFGRSQTFSYDNVNRLQQADGGYGLLDYLYDPVGNRLSRQLTEGGSTAISSYDYAADSNRLTSVTLPSESTPYTFTYDAVGNIVHDPRLMVTLTYNEANRMSAIDGSFVSSQFQHNALGQRVIKLMTALGTTETTYYHYDEAGRLALETDTQGQVIREYLYADGQLLAVVRPGAKADSDGDGLDDDWERQFFGDLSRDGSGDADGDGYSDLVEFQQGTQPDAAAVYPGNRPAEEDTDGDGLLDVWEYTHFGTLDRGGNGDFDNDGASDRAEYEAGTDPTDPADSQSTSTGLPNYFLLM